MRRALLLLAVVSCATPPESRGLRVLLFGAEGADVGWHHLSNPIAPGILKSIGGERGWAQIDATWDGSIFTDEGLSHYDVVVFLISSGTVLTPDQEAALQRFLHSGHGYAGVHSASFTQEGSDWYLTMVGAKFWGHAPGLWTAAVDVMKPGDPMMSGLPTRWTRYDEWYIFERRPEDNHDLELLVAMDESTLPDNYPPELRIGFHANTWRHVFEGGRVFYTAMGHSVESWSEPEFLRLVADGIEWAGEPSRSRSP